MSQPVTLNVHLQAALGQEAALAESLMALLSPTRAERGCINYDLHRNLQDPSKFMFYENWATQEALDQHIATPHIQAFLAKTATLLIQPMSLTTWQKIN